MDGTRSLVTNGEIYIYGVIDPISFGEASFVRAVDVIRSLAEISARTVTVHINSPGGAIYEGLAIYDALKASEKRIIVRVDAVAASIASIVAMAGDEIVMADNASIMIHNPMAVAAGESEDFRALAGELDRLKERLVNIYTSRSNLPRAEIEKLMDAETTFFGNEAVEAGFADRVDLALKIAACATVPDKSLARLLAAPSTIRAERPMPAAPAAQHEERLMSQNTAAAAAGPVAAANVATAPDPASAPAVAPVVAAPVAAVLAAVNAADPDRVILERQRIQGIYAHARTAKIGDAFADDLVRTGVPLAEAQARIVNKWSEQQTLAEGGGTAVHIQSHVRVEQDGIDRWVEGAAKGLMGRINMKGGERNEFTGLTLSELARSALAARNIKSGHMDRMTMIGAAFTARNSGPGYHSTSDFGFVLASTARRAVLTGYEEAEETFDQWTGRGTASDFRAISRVDMGLFPGLEKVEEGAEYKYATIGDTGTTVQVATYGKMFAITRQAIINDDLGFFDRVPRRMGRAAKRTIGNLVYAILNGNPTMQDGVALFHATHGNLAGTPAILSVGSIGGARAAMARQKDPEGISTGIGVRPKFMLLPPELVDLATTILAAEKTPGDAAGTPNAVRNAATAISDGRLSGTAWYLAGNPAQVDTIEVTYLDGQSEPFTDQRDGWNVDGTEFKVRIDAGVKALHWRGLYKNAGA